MFGADPAWGMLCTLLWDPRPTSLFKGNLLNTSSWS